MLDSSQFEGNDYRTAERSRNSFDNQNLKHNLMN